MRIVIVILMMLVNTCIFSMELPEYSQAYDPERNAFKDFEMALNDAKQNHQLVLIELGGDWCKFCHRLDKFLKKNPKTKQHLLEVFVIIKINVSEENWNEEFRSHLPEFNVYPQFFITDREGHVIGAQNVFDLEVNSSYSKVLFKRFIKHWSKINQALAS